MVSNKKSIPHLRMLDLDVAFQHILVGCLGHSPRSPRVNLAHDHDHDHHPHCWMPHFSGQQKTGVMMNYKPNTTQYCKGNHSKLRYICMVWSSQNWEIFMTPATSLELGRCFFFPNSQAIGKAVFMTAVLWNDGMTVIVGLLGWYKMAAFNFNIPNCSKKPSKMSIFGRTSKWFFCIWNWTSKKGEKWFLGQGGFGSSRAS